MKIHRHSTWRVARNGLYILAVCCMITSCSLEPSGGGTFHVPPTSMVFDKPLHLELKAVVHGGGRGKMRDRWTDFVCFYRLIGDTTWQQIPMVIVNEQKESILVGVDIPGFQATNRKGVEYYITFIFDGYPGARDAPSNRSTLNGATLLGPIQVFFETPIPQKE